MSEYIERGAAISAIEEKQKELCPVGMYSRHAGYGSDREKFDEWQEIIDTLEAMPAAYVRPVVKAEWYGEADGYADGYPVYDMWSCPVCGKRFDEWEEKPDWNFCPNCGADMRELNNGCLY